MKESLHLEEKGMIHVVFRRLYSQRLAVYHRLEDASRRVRVNTRKNFRRKEILLGSVGNEPLPVAVILLHVIRGVVVYDGPIISPWITREHLVSTGAGENNLHESRCEP